MDELNEYFAPQPSFLDNFAAGYADNYNNPIAVNNFKPTEKPVSTRMGEVAGTALRAFDSPLVRGLLAAGATALSGGDRGDMLREGLSAFGTRQNVVAADRLYRSNLKQMGYSDADLAGIRGNINGETYKNLTNNLTKMQKMQLQQAIADTKDITSRQRLVLDGVNRGIISPEEGRLQLEMLGRGANLQESNQSKLTDSKLEVDQARIKEIDARIAQGQQKISLLRQKVNLGIANQNDRHALAELNKQVKALQIQKLQQELEDNGLGGNSTPVSYVRVKAPNGKVGTIPAANLQRALQQGYKQIGN